MSHSKIEKRNVEDMMGLTAMQEGMLFHYLSDPGSNQYFEQIRIRLAGKLEVELFKEAWQAIVRSNEMLRSVIRWEKLDEPVQIILKEKEIPLSVHDFSVKAKQEQPGLLEKICQEDKNQSIDLANEPLRLTLCILDDREAEMIITFHHIIYDGWSNGIILKEFVGAYEVLCRGPKKRHLRKTKYKEFFKWYRSLPGNKQDEFWKTYLEGFDTRTTLPYDRSKVADITRVKTHKITLLPEIKGRVDNSLQVHNITLAAFMFTAWGLLLQRYNNSPDVIFGVTVSGRTPAIKGIENIVGLFINTLPLRLKLDTPGEDTIGNLFHRVGIHLNELSAHGHEHTSLTRIRKFTSIGKENDLFDSIVVIDNYPLEGIEPGENLAIRSFDQFEMTNFDLTLQILPSGSQDTLDICFHYNEELFRFETIQRMADHFYNITAAITNESAIDKKTADICMISPQEKEQILLAFNNPDIHYMGDKSIHGIIQDQAERVPDRVAVVMKTQHLSYREFDRESDKLAGLLQESGVVVGSRVALMLPRSVEMIVGVLAILKAGAACIPLDITYPEERSNFIIEDSGAMIMIGREEKQKSGRAEFKFSSFFPASPLPHFLTSDSSNLAYIIYTSGSTGKPKGALLNHWGIVNHTYTKIGVLGITETDIVGNNFSINVIASVWQILSPLFTGAKLVLYSDEIEWDPYLQFQRVAADAVTVIEVIPPVLKTYLFLLDEGKLVVNLAGLRKIALTSEETKPFLVNKFYERYRETQLVDCYGQTECSDDVLHYTIPADTNTRKVPIGTPSLNTQVLILSRDNQLQPIGVVGEICVSGAGVAEGYWNRPEMNKEKFVTNPLNSAVRMYRTGDLGCWMPDGKVEYLGRIDHQVKIRGNRVELREIENHVIGFEAVKEAAVIAREDKEGEKSLYAFFEADREVTTPEIRQYLLKTLPDYMVPAYFVKMDNLPHTPNGKIDRKALARVDVKSSIGTGAEYKPPRNDFERKIETIWRELLDKEKIGIHDNFFDLGGHSLLLIKLKSKLEKTFEREITIVDLFNYPTIDRQAQYFEGNGKDKQDQRRTFPGEETVAERSHDVAVIGMALRIPGADGIAEFWENICKGVESITFFNDDELEGSRLYEFIQGNARRVPAGGVLGNIDLFDADFFGFMPREAEIIDPQQRMFLEYTWMALEDAGYVGETYPGSIGVYAGTGWNTYLMNNVLLNPEVIRYVGEFQTMIGNDKDFLATRVSYKLNLKGPSVTVQSACSTSMVAIHLAKQGLLNRECDMALAGGVAIKVPERTGYFYNEGGHLSPDGHCRAFDADARGTVFGNGLGIVVLKRLADALDDNDHIYAVIKGSAVNNDGSLKVGFHSPSEAGQADVVFAALREANIDPGTIGYVETHGTGTLLGDPVEMTALARAYREYDSLRNNGNGKLGKQYCAVGSVKANIGHLDAAAGVTGFIKAVLCLYFKKMPPSINVTEPNPIIDFPNTPFYVIRELQDWPTGKTPRRAAASSLGIGGTNAHAILEEYTHFEKTAPLTPAKTFHYLVLLSARTESALRQTTHNLVNFIKRNMENPAADTLLANVSYTLSTGRKAFDHRLALVCQDNQDAVETLETFNPKRLIMHTRTPGDKSIIFMFPGVGEHYVNMTSQLYRQYPIFRREVDTCSEILEPLLQKDLRKILFVEKNEKTTNHTGNTSNIDLKKLLNREETFSSEEEQVLSQTIYSQTSVFVVEYALARLLIDWGIKPYAMIGYSIGEYTAACLAGVFSLQDALFLVANRARLIHSLEKGAMLAVSLPEQELKNLMADIKDISIAAINSPDLCIVSGEAAGADALETLLNERKVVYRRLKTFQAFHSHMMEAVREELTGMFKKVSLHPPIIPYISNVSGTWITPEQAVTPDYWVTHTVSSIRFAEGIGELLRTSCNFFLEIGPGNSLCGFTAQHPQAKQQKQEDRFVLASMPKESERVSGDAFLLRALGKLWAAGLEIHWPSFYKYIDQSQYTQQRKRIPLPTYPFERKRYWLEADSGNQKQEMAIWGQVQIPKKENISDWFYLPSWKLSLLPTLEEAMNRQKEESWLIFVGDSDIGFQLIQQLQMLQMMQTERITQGSHYHITIVKIGKQFEKHTGEHDNQYIIYEINPGKYEDYIALLEDLCEQGKGIDKIIHLWQWDSTGANGCADFLERGVYSLLYLVKALAKLSIFNAMELWAVSKGLHKIESTDTCEPGKAAILGPCKVISQEYPHIKCRSIDFSGNTAGTYEESRIVRTLLAELWASPPDPIIAYRGVNRWIRSYEPVKLDKGPEVPIILREKGIYLIVGGLGNIGMSIARYLAMAVQARLVLTSRSELPANEDHPRRQKIKELEEMGAEVSVVQVEAGDKNQLRQAVEHAEEKYGVLHGVLYAAGVMNESAFKLIADSDRQDCEQHFRPKIRGLLALEEVLREREKDLDFCILTSSLSPILGGLSLYAYSAANSFMDGFANKQSLEHGKNWISINWADWESNSGKPINDRCATLVRGSTVVQLNITAGEGQETFKRVLSLASGGNSIPGIVISSGDLERRLQQWVSPEETNEGKTPALHKRPQQLQSIYEAPQNEAEKIVAEIWQELLGIEMVGVYDNFFELGGHSLIATKLMSRLREVFRIDLPLSILFDNPTIREVVTYIIDSWGDSETVTEIAKVYREVFSNEGA